jgi:hypothetical protein
VAKNYREELRPVVLFKGTTKREYVVVKKGERNISFTFKFSEATIFKQYQADVKAVNFPSHHLKKIELNE